MPIIFNIERPQTISFIANPPNVITFKVPPYIAVAEKTKKEAITITENGTYNAPVGISYNQVTVNVPIPKNYGLITYNGYEITVS